MSYPLDAIFQLVCGGRFTTLNGNPTVFTGPAIDETAANAVGVGDVTLTTPAMAAGQYAMLLSCHTADRYAVCVDTSATAKRITVRDNAAAAEGIVQAWFLERTS